ncbi:MAG: HAMP domain-containing sensor histidine kinase [Lachnospiraceae bacterium]|nr:HAMP domain-containing sensor histidine kinase [Lachnospiraceae bacterium]
MFRKLHVQLTALCITITGLILAVLSVICLFISESGIRRQEYDSFSANLNALYQNLAQQTSLSHNWIRQMEHSYQFSIQILDNGVPLFFQSLDTNDIPEDLWNTVREKAVSDYGLDFQDFSSLGILSRHEEFPITDESGRPYTASAALIPRSGGSIGVTVLHPLTEMNRRILGQRLAFVTADLAALIILSIFYWFFTARMIRPLQENRKKQMQFVASASHELRSPLTVILSNVAAVKNGIMPNDHQFLNTLYSEGNRMSRLISDMLQLASADNHTWSMQPSEVEIDTLLLQTWENFESMASARQLHWKITLPDEPVPRCTCDAERIRQLLSILIDNAFCYTPQGGHIRLALSDHAPGPQNPGAAHGACKSSFRKPALRRHATRSQGSSGCLYISVSDDGPGIPDEQKTAVFERFHRVDASRKDKSHFGLGLCIAQEIAQLHRGQLLLTDTPGGGATFTLMLPLG